ncbi:MAG: iron-containing alcohol dehydrogenase [Promethearchaeota archaeon]
MPKSTNIKKKSWYELPHNKEFVMRTSREAPRAFLWNLWTPKVMLGKAAIGFLSIFLAEQFKKEERKVLIVCDPFLESSGIRVQKSLSARGFECKIWKGIQPEVPLETVQEGVKVCDSFSPKILVAIGGGSTIDTAKMIFLLYEKPDIDYYNLIPINALGIRKKIKKLIAIPTTSGTGSEATYGSMVKDTSQTPPKKINVAILELLPDIAILSPEFVKNMPPKLTASTGIDALVHAFSAYLNSCRNTLSDIMSLEAIKIILKYLPRAYKRGNDMEAREKMQIAAFLAGLAISNSGVSMEHSLGHSFGTVFHVHHGISVGLFNPYAIQFIAKNSDRYIAIAELFGIETKNRKNQEILNDLIKIYKNFLKSMDLPTSIKEIKDPKIDEDTYMNKLDQLIAFAWDDICTFDSIRVPNKEDYKKIFIYAYNGKNIDF